jgi:hypothetical protein
MMGDDFDRAVGGIITSQAFDASKPEDGEYQELEQMDTFKDIVRDLKVLARASSDHKKKLVIGLKACGIEVGDVFEALPDDKAKAGALKGM